VPDYRLGHTAKCIPPGDDARSRGRHHPAMIQLTTTHPPRAPVACRSLSKTFGGPPAVDDLSFEVAAGTITGFVGANGAGKTTTMRMLLGLVSPTSGQALIAGQPYRELIDPRHQVGAVLDRPGAHPRHTARTHLRILAAAAAVDRSQVEEVLGLVDLAHAGDTRVGTFSLGMRQRLALAAALLADPPILLLDEPVNGLDPRGILWMRDLLRGLAGEGRAILVSSHLLSELAEIAHRVVIIDHGRLIADAAIDELADGRSLEEVYFELAGSLGSPPPNEVRPVSGTVAS
jgi:ABC-2 type transport system ATP-binding protein